jgi:hypothetical protein
MDDPDSAVVLWRDAASRSGRGVAPRALDDAQPIQNLKTPETNRSANVFF